MEEDIKYLDKMVKEYKQFGDLHNPEYEDTDRIYNAIENLIKGYRRLELENQALENTKNNCPEMNTSGFRCKLKENGITSIGIDFSYDGYIPKSKIEEKLEELKERNKKGYAKLQKSKRCKLETSNTKKHGSKN